MLVFVIPLKSAQVSTSWENVSKLFERCVRSICSQTSSNYRVIVVCHEKPQIEFSHPYISYFEVNFLPPGPELADKYRDKARKKKKGLIYAQHFQPTHTFLVDADDCVSKHLAEFVSHHPQVNGWFMNKGYEYKDGSQRIYLRSKNFHHLCGTCNIVKYDLLDHDCLRLHNKVEENMKKKGLSLKELPFIGAVYVTENGENVSPPHNYGKREILEKLCNPREFLLFNAKEAYKRMNSRPLTKAICDEYGIYSIS